MSCLEILFLIQRYLMAKTIQNSWSLAPHSPWCPLSEIFLGSGSSIELNTVCGLKSRENAEKSFRRLSFERLKLQKNNIYIWKPLNSGFWSYVQLCGGNNHSFYLMLVRPQNATHKGANNSRVQGFYSKIIYKALGYY